MGEGFLIGQPGTIDLAPARVATDLHLLLGERLNNLFKHGIVNQHLKALYETAGKELSRSAEAISKSEFSWLWKDAVPAWSHLDSIYSEVEHTQRDVLSGVMFFVALLVPFAYCMERYFFAFRTIYRQISAFFVFLLLAILALRNLNPAFQLTYSPMVVILAFFIVALSVLVSLIIFMRFEREMAELHSKASHIRTPRVSKWQAFGAGFAIGVSNLNRRKLRTALTCITLIILTFTVMSFTSVKSFRKTTQTEIADSASQYDQRDRKSNV